MSVLAICALAAPGDACAASDRGGHAPLRVSVDGVARAALAESPLVGVSIGVSFVGEHFAQGYGLANLEHEVPASAETVYHLDSISKNITASAVLRLVEEGKLSLDEDLGKFVPEFRGRGVLIRHLLNHTSGIKDYSSLPEFEKEERLDLDHEAVLRLVKDQPADFAPGSSWAYDNSGFYLLGLVIEKVSGQGYFDFVRETFLKPLGMNATVYGIAQPIIKHRAQGYIIEHGQQVNADAISWVPVFSGGAWCSTVDDTLHWEDALEEGRVVSKEMLEKMRTPTQLPNGPIIDYGFGTRIGSLEGHRCYGHTGTGGGFANVMLSFPDDQLRIVVLKNSEGTLAATTIAARLARAILELPLPSKVEPTLSEQELARFTGKFKSSEGVVEGFARDGHLWARIGSSGEGSRLRYQGEGVFSIGEESIVRFWPAEGQAEWGLQYNGGLFLSAARRVR
ncbi:MAG: serine hydrolase domain-containing protein [Chthoniobacterales bacterium]